MTGLLFVLWTVVEALIVAAMAQRILGIPVDWPRTLLVSLAIVLSLSGLITAREVSAC